MLQTPAMQALSLSLRLPHKRLLKPAEPPWNAAPLATASHSRVPACPDRERLRAAADRPRGSGVVAQWEQVLCEAARTPCGSGRQGSDARPPREHRVRPPSPAFPAPAGFSREGLALTTTPSTPAGGAQHWGERAAAPHNPAAPPSEPGPIKLTVHGRPGPALAGISITGYGNAGEAAGSTTGRGRRPRSSPRSLSRLTATPRASAPRRQPRIDGYKLSTPHAPSKTHLAY